MAHRFKTVKPIFRLLLSLLLADTVAHAEPLPIDPLWKSTSFRRAFTASYGIDSRIEPPIDTAEKAVLDTVARKMAAKDRPGAISALIGSSILTKSAALRFNLGNLRFEEARLDDAATNFQKALELYPNFRDAHRNLAVVLIQQDKFTDAEPHLTRAIELGARDGGTLGLLGYVHAVADRQQPALQAYRLAQMTQPDEIQWKIGEAQALLALQDHAAAESLFDALIQEQPSHRGLWLQQASLWFESEHPDNAIANLELAHRMSPLSPSEQISLGHLYLREDLIEPAEKHYLDALSREPAAPVSVALDAAEYLLQLEEWTIFEKAAAIIEEAYEFEPSSDTHSRFTRQKALYALEIGQTDKGALLVEALLSQNPLDGQALILLSRYRDHQGRPEEATHLLEQAVKSPEVAAEALFQLGKRAVTAARYKDALSYLEESLEIEPRPGLETYLEQIRTLAR